MATYKCLECGHVFDEYEIDRWSEYQGEYWGSESYERMSGCPKCHGAYDEVVYCEKCGEPFLKEEMTEGLCPECAVELIEEYRYDVDKCYALCDGDTESVKIDFFLSRMFTPEQINEILLRELHEAAKVAPVDCAPYVFHDEEWTVEAILWDKKAEEKRKGVK